MIVSSKCKRQFDLCKGYFVTLFRIDFLAEPSSKTKTVALISDKFSTKLFASVNGNSDSNISSIIGHSSPNLDAFKLYDSFCNIGNLFSFTNHTGFIKWGKSCRSFKNAVVDNSRLFESTDATYRYSPFQIFSSIQMTISENNYHQVGSSTASSTTNYSHKNRYAFNEEQQYFFLNKFWR